ncbi:MAG: hypothetical protein ABS91_01890 [Thiobacillus sp. SCN 64-35]|nr:MAG: hypothetical protein ABS91_01890 [Thiobacillus sp. SCN 64-35]
MLQYILDDLPGLSMPTGESHFIIPLFRSQTAYADVATPAGMRRLLQTLHDFNAEFLDTDLHGVKFDVEALAQAFLAEGRASVRDVISGIFEHNARGMGKTRWGDKTPYYALHLDKLTEWWPGAKIIHLVRDGRDVALSLFGRQHDFSAYNVYYAAQYWQKYVDVCREQGRRLPAGQYLEIRYEDVLNDQDAAMRSVCDFIGEPLPDAAQHPKAGLDAASRQLKTVNRDNQAKWRRALNAWQIRVFESEAGPTLRQSGYPLLTSARRLPLPVRALYRLHNALAIRLYRFLGRNRSKLNFVVRPARAQQPSSTS